ncbi:hypothetical protein AK812_SmicGene5557 [Symbiodinium microadriaticum]|uniref:Uncharacterized protein n=1 Tax=Symbiodinium microadriaticum TaxID=2951 RepID=A0A1Q9ETG4_SYMMI|nr:hypothetical protein AK812_SmicGene5557 [Symbiodinium microadriaticum]
MFDNFTHSSASTDTGLGEQLKQLWESNLQSRIIAPCERWCRANDLGKLTRHEYVAKAKNDQCNWNALVGAMSGAIPVPGLDAASSLAGGFLLQAQGACIVAKLRGYDVQDEKTQSLILWSLAGEAGSEIVKGATQLAAKSGGSAAGKRALKSVPNQFLRQVNKKVWPLIGRSLITKGPRGLMSLSKMIPVLGSAAGAVAGAAVDWFFCHRAIDFADQKVFLMLNKEEEDLRAYLLTNDFEDVVKPLMDARFDTQTICDAEKSACHLYPFYTDRDLAETRQCVSRDDEKGTPRPPTWVPWTPGTWRHLQPRPDPVHPENHPKPALPEPALRHAHPGQRLPLLEQGPERRKVSPHRQLQLLGLLSHLHRQPRHHLENSGGIAPTADLTVNTLTATSFVEMPLLQSAVADLQIQNATTTIRAEDGALLASFAAGNIGLEQDITVRADRTLNATTADFAQFFMGSMAATGAFTRVDRLVGIMSQGRGGALRPGFRKVLAQRLFELEHTTRDDVTQLYNGQERAAFERGYRAAVQDVLVLVGAGLAGAAFLTVCLSPALYQKVREKVRPWVVRQVELGRPWVIWIQRFRHPLLDRVHLLAANSCGGK